MHTWKPRDSVHYNPLYHYTSRETSSLSLESKNTRLFSETFTMHLYANQEFQEKAILTMGEPMCKSIGSKEVNQQPRIRSAQQKSYQSTFVSFIKKILIDLNTTIVESNVTIIEHVNS